MSDNRVVINPDGDKDFQAEYSDNDGSGDYWSYHVNTFDKNEWFVFDYEDEVISTIKLNPGFQDYPQFVESNISGTLLNTSRTLYDAIEKAILRDINT